MNLLRIIFLLSLTVLLFSIGCYAEVVDSPQYSWEFRTDADFLGWTADGFTQVAVSGGSIKGTTTKFPFLNSPLLTLDSQQYPTLTFTAKSNCSGMGSIYFRHAGEILADSRAVSFQIRGDGQFHRYVVDFTVNPQWKGIIEQIRFDTVYVPNASVEISQISFLRTNAKAAADKLNLLMNGDFSAYSPDRVEAWSVSPNTAGSFKVQNVSGRDSVAVLQTTQAKSTVSIEQPVEFDYSGYYMISLDALPVKVSNDDTAVITLKYLDILGNPLKNDLIWKLKCGSSNWSTLKKSFIIPEKAASGTFIISLHSASGGSSIYLDDIKLLLDTVENSKASTMNSGKAFSWDGEWIWAPISKSEDQSPVYFRKSFDLPDMNKAVDARVIVTADNECTLAVNGRNLPKGRSYDNWKKPDIYNIKPYLRSGVNVLAVTAINHGGPSGMILEAGIHSNNKDVIFLKSDSTWKCSHIADSNWSTYEFDDTKWQNVISIAKPPSGAWADVVPYTYLGPSTDIAFKNLNCARRVVSGSKLPYSVTLSSEKKIAPGTFLFIDLVKDGFLSGTSLLRQDLSDQNSSKEIKISGVYDLPVFTAPGKYHLNISITNSKPVVLNSVTAIVKDGFVMLPITVQKKPRVIKNPVCKFKMVNGSPMFVINGKPHTALNYWAEDTSVKGLIQNCKENGIHIYWLGVNGTMLQKSGKFDFAKMDNAATSLLTQDPDAYIILIVPIDGVYNTGLHNWMESHKDEMVRDSKGSVDIPDYGDNPSHASSLASKKWISLAENLMRQLIRHARTGKYADRVIGYLPCSGVTYEWQQWASTTAPAVFVDYSEPARLAFIKWLQNKYSDIGKLNAAWKTSLGSFNDIQIPSKEDRLKTDYMTFLDPEKSMREIDYRQYYSELVAFDILHITKVVKEETKGESTVGVFYGYVTHVLSPYRYQLIGHTAMHKVLSSPDIDFLMSPSDYGDRQVGGGSGLMGPVGSVKLNNKIWVDQADLRTHYSQQLPRFMSLADDKAGVIRNYANALVNACSEQLYDFSLGWVSGDKRLMQLAGKLQKIDQLVAKTDRMNEDKSNSLAVIIDEKSTYYTGMASAIHSDMVNYQYIELSRTGIGFDMYLLDDIAKIPNHKCYLFLNTFRITKKQQVVIEQKLKKSGKTLIFVYAPGITDEKSILPQRVSEITGINMSLLDKEILLRVKTDISSDPVFKYLPNSMTYGSFNPYGPILVPTEGTQLGTIESMPEKPGLVIKRYADWTSVFSVATAMPANLLRGIAESAGVTIANPFDTDITYGSGNLLVVHTSENGERKLHFKLQTGKVTELMSDKTYALNSGTITLPLNARSTYIFMAK